MTRAQIYVDRARRSEILLRGWRHDVAANLAHHGRLELLDHRHRLEIEVSTLLLVSLRGGPVLVHDLSYLIAFKKVTPLRLRFL